MKISPQVVAKWTKLKSSDGLKVVIAVSLALIVILSVTALLLLKPAEYTAGDDQAPVVVEDALRHPLTGEVLQTPLAARPQVFGVMVENSADAWPLSGIEEAFLVIEAPVEGGIPRFLAFFSAETEVDKIGPVRSARPYYLDWNAEFGSVYAHVGGSPEALDLIKQTGVLDLNEFYQGEYYWRDNATRSAPHNVYTSTELLLDATEELEPEPASYGVWSYKVDAPLDVEPVSVTIDWGQGSLYDVTWEYVASSNNYLRQQGDEAVESQDGDQILAKNVVVIATDITVIDNVGRRRIDTLGEGDALLVQDGRIILARWKKLAANERLRFYDVEGQELKLNAGQTWIEVVSALDKVTTFTDLPL